MPSSPSPGAVAERALLVRTQSVLPGLPFAEPAPKQPAYLIVFEGEVAYRFDLGTAGTAVIGRAPDAALRLDQPTASRHHARIDVQSDGIWLSDLDSRNGTRLNGQVIKGARRLSHGDTIGICNATLILQQHGGAAALRPFASLAQLRVRLEEEIDRTVRHQRPFVLLSIRLVSDEHQTIPPRAVVAEALSGALRMMDVPCWQTDDSLLLLCLELSPAEGEILAQRLMKLLRPIAPAIHLRLVACPRDGTDADLLLHSCTPEGPVPEAKETVAGPDSDVHNLKLGNQTILIVEPTMKRLYALLERLAPSDIALLIQGETGCGKELAASAVHHFSKRKDRPLVAVNCAALPENLAESELFGHERGAFSGAVTSKPGLFETANGGTLFLDEIGELSQAIQAKLLRVLETKRILRVGDVRERSIDVRLAAATHRDLQADVASGRFRQDLYFRLAVARVYLPPLRDRRREILFLARSFLHAACARAQRLPMEIAPTAQHLLTNYTWPGNIRQLRNMMEYAAAAVEEDVLLPYHISQQIEPPGAVSAAAAGEPVSPLHPRQAERPATIPSGIVNRTEGEDGGSVLTPRTFRPIDEEIRELERQRMIEALDASGGVHVRAAALISMPIRTFTGKLKTLNISTREKA